MVEREEELDDLGSYWSISKLQTISECGRKFEYRYIKHSKEYKGLALKFGSVVHKCLELMHKEAIWGEGGIQRLWADKWLSVVSTVDWEQEEASKTTYKNRGLKMLQQYKDDHQQDDVLATEIRFRVKDEITLAGIIDKVVMRNGYPAIVDYKTSKYPPDPLVLGSDPQLTTYFIASKSIGYETDQLCIHNLLDGKEYWTTRSLKDVDMLWESIHEAQQKIKHQMFARNVGFNCKYCPFKTECLTRNDGSIDPTEELPPTQ